MATSDKMAKHMNNIPCIEPFIVDGNKSTNLDKLWRTWKDDLDLFLLASGVSNDTQKKALLLHLGGKDIKEIYRSLQNSSDKYEDVIDKLDNHFQPKKNVTYERYLFKQEKQHKDESASSYVTRLRRIAETCEYSDTDTEIRDHFIVTCVSSTLKRKLLQESDLTLQKLLEIARNQETSAMQASQMTTNETEKSENVNSMKFNTRNFNHKTRKPFNTKRPNNCKYCGEKFNRGHLKVCKAKGKICFNCGGKNHLSVACLKPKQNISQNRNNRNVVQCVENESENESEAEFLFTVQKNIEQSEFVKGINLVKTGTLKIDGISTSMMIDSGSTVTIIDKSTFENLKRKKPEIVLNKSVSKLYPYASKPLKLKGYFTALLETKDRMCESKIYVVENKNSGNILGIQCAEKLKLIEIKQNNTESKQRHRFCFSCY